jgi:hypothetical protein
MPRKRRSLKRRDTAPIRPSVQHYLVTGEITLERSDNPWMVMSLTQHARAALACWERGDEAGTRAALARCPGRAGWFVVEN